MADHYQKFIDASMSMLELNMSIYLLLITPMAYIVFDQIRFGWKAIIFCTPSVFRGLPRISPTHDPRRFARCSSRGKCHSLYGSNFELNSTVDSNDLSNWIHHINNR